MSDLWSIDTEYIQKAAILLYGEGAEAQRLTTGLWVDVQDNYGDYHTVPGSRIEGALSTAHINYRQRVAKENDYLNAHVFHGSTFFGMLHEIKKDFKAGVYDAEFPKTTDITLKPYTDEQMDIQISGPFPDEDEESTFIRVSYELPKDVYVEVDGGTWGELHAIRIYKDASC